MMIRETFINLDKNATFGDPDWVEAWTDDVGKLFKSLAAEYGRCTGKAYIERKGEPDKPCGWVFQKRMRYEDARGHKPSDYYMREVWVYLADRVEVVPKKTKVEYHALT